MPLDTNDEAALRILKRFDDAVGCNRCNLEVPPWILDGLMVITVYFNLCFSSQIGDQTSFRYPNQVSRRIFRMVRRIVVVVCN